MHNISSLRAPITRDTQAEFARQLRSIAHADIEKVQHVIFAATHSDKLGTGAEAHVYAVPEYSKLALRVKISEHGNFTEPFHYVPIQYSQALAFLNEDTSFGLPHAALVGNTHPAARARALFPHEAVPNYDTTDAAVASIAMWLVRKRSGIAPNAGHRHAFARLVRWDVEPHAHPQPGDESTFRLFTRLRYENQSGDVAQARRNIQACAAGTYHLPRAVIGGAAEACTPTFQRLFLGRYRRFADAYAASIERIASLEQRAFDRAVLSLLRLDAAHEKVRMDYAHAGNIVIDFAKQHIAFVDLNFRAASYANARAGDFDLLLDALLGRGPGGHWSDIIDPADRLRLRRPISQIIERMHCAVTTHNARWQTHDPRVIDTLGQMFTIAVPERTLFAPEFGIT